MTPQNAYKMLGVNKKHSMKFIEKTYLELLTESQSRLIPGNTLSIRTQAEQQIIHLTNAMNCLQVHHKNFIRRKAKEVSKKKQKNGTPAPKPHPEVSFKQNSSSTNDEWALIIAKILGRHYRATVIGTAGVILVIVYLLIMIVTSGCCITRNINANPTVKYYDTISTKNTNDLNIAAIQERTKL